VLGVADGGDRVAALDPPRLASAGVGETTGISRRGLLALGAGAGAVAAAGGSVRAFLWEKLRWTEDFFPGDPPDHRLVPQAWTTTEEGIRFAVLGDNGSGGRNAMNVARAMADEYERSPYGVVLLAGDISYYGSIDDRWEDVFVRPYRPLIDAGVEWELAIGNHEIEEKRSPDAAAEIDAQLRRFGKPGTYYRVRHGPVDVFVLDSSTPAATGEKAAEQLAWLDGALADSAAPWKVALLHHPPYSSGKHGSDLDVRAALEPRFVDGGIDVVFTGHDHHYERTLPQDGVTYFVSGGGCKLSRSGASEFTAYSSSILQFLHCEVRGDEMEVRCIRDNGDVADQVVITRRGATG
jgi:3',5'-cyclic AMP phosphodiesterase CpdA